jgi:hypothetical protein
MNVILDMLINAAIVLVFFYCVIMAWIDINAYMAKVKRNKRRCM